MTARAMKISSMAHLTALFRRCVTPDVAMGVDESLAMAGGLQVHRLRVAEIAAIGNIHLIVASHA